MNHTGMLYYRAPLKEKARVSEGLGRCVAEKFRQGRPAGAEVPGEALQVGV